MLAFCMYISAAGTICTLYRPCVLGLADNNISKSQVASQLEAAIIIVSPAAQLVLTATLRSLLPLFVMYASVPAVYTYGMRLYYIYIYIW